MGEEFFLEVLGDPLFDDDVVAVHLLELVLGIGMRSVGVRVDAYLVPVPGQAIGNESVREEMLAMDLLIYVRYLCVGRNI